MSTRRSTASQSFLADVARSFAADMTHFTFPPGKRSKCKNDEWVRTAAQRQTRRLSDRSQVARRRTEHDWRRGAKSALGAARDAPPIARADWTKLLE